MSKFKAHTTIFTRENASHAARINLPDGYMVAILVRGCQPTLSRLDGQGAYDVDCPENPDDKWPVVFCVIDSAHEQAWAAITVEAVNRILDRCERAAYRVMNGLPHQNGNPHLLS